MIDESTEDDARAERVDRAILAYLEEVDAGRAPDPHEWLGRHPDLADELRAFFADHDGVGRLARPLRSAAAEGGPVSDDEPEPLPPPVGGYRPVRLLGAGGMGRVYEAEDPSGRRVALKLLAPTFARSRVAVERFRQEGRLAGRVTHPRCVFVFKADAEAGRPYIAMELMSGATLKDLVERDGPLSVGDAVAKVLDAIDGLAEAHRAGVLHRDVKPANCYVEADGRVKVGDFGLSRSLTVNLHLTRTGGFVGTPLFASPEQLRGEPLDERTDVYSVAATLYYLLTGRAPFQGAEGASLVARVVSEPVPPPRGLRPDVPPALEAVLLRGLERQRGRRYRDLDEFRAALLPHLPGRLSIAGVGLRLGAYFLDTVPFSVAAGLAGVALLRPGADLSLAAYLTLATPVFLYFVLGDGLGGGTPGKRLLRLRVTRAGGCEAPGLVRGLVRALVFLGMTGTVWNLCLHAFWPDLGPVARSLCQVTGSFLGLALCFSTLRGRNGYRGLHELLSGTRVVQLPPAGPGRKARGGEEEAPPSQPPAPRPLPAGLPPQVGPFAIRGALRWDGDERLLLGEDASLERRVWVRLGPAAGGVSPARKEVARPTRLRWLAEGSWAGRHWDAFVAPAGEPLTDLVARRGPLPWRAARALLEQLADELSAAAADGTLPARLAPDQVWVGPPGRVQLLDDPGAGEPTGDADGRSLTLLRQVAALALARPEDGCPVRAPLPLHARSLLQRLAGAREPYRRLADLQADLAATHDRPTEVTPVLRGLHLALSSCFLFLGVVVMLVWTRFGAVAPSVVLDQELLRIRVLRHVLDDAEALPALLRALPPDAGPRRDPAGFRHRLERRLAEDREELTARLRDLGPFTPVYRVLPAIRAHPAPGGEEEPLRFERQPGDPLTFRVVRLDLPDEAGLAVTADMLTRVARGIEEDPASRRAVRIRATAIGGAVVHGLFPALWVVWAFLFRGGLGLRLAGLALVRGGGKPAWRLQCAGRALLVWAPPVALSLLGVWLEAAHPGLSWLGGLLPGPIALLLLAYVVLALRFPPRGPHDRIVGTYLVPR